MARLPLYPAFIGVMLSMTFTACETTPVEIELTETVELVLSTSLCEPEEEPVDHFFAAEDAPFRIAWETLCVRDSGEVNWYAVKVSYWEDRAEDAWNVWLIDPTIDSVRYGEATIPAVVDANVVNTNHPNALERVAPALLEPGDYRVEVWAVVDDYLDSQRSEVRLTLVD